MKHTSLRRLMKTHKLERPYTLEKRVVIMDGHCLTQMYKRSNLHFILGGEYDRFACYLKNIMSQFIECSITCYVIFSGGGIMSIDKRKLIHQKIIDRTDALSPDSEDNCFCEPVFVKDVCKDVLDELGIKHFTCMYGHKNTLFTLAKKYNYIILSNNFEYSLYGTSVFTVNSVKYHKESKNITGSIYSSRLCHHWSTLSDDVMSVFLAITNENIDCYHELLGIFKVKPERYIFTVFYWIKRQSKNNAVSFLTKYLTPNYRKVLLDAIDEISELFFKPKHNLAIEYFSDPTKSKKKTTTDTIFSNSFENAVATGKIAPVYVTLRDSGIFSGTWLVTDKNQEDAMLPALDIAFYALRLLTNSKHAKVTFIGRKYNASDATEIERVFNMCVSADNILDSTTNHFLNFVAEQLPGFDLKILEGVSEECWILLISILYYSIKSKKHFTKETYCIILSYVLLGPVSKRVGVIKKSNFSVTHQLPNESDQGNVDELYSNYLTYQECVSVANAVVDMFYLPEGRLKDVYDREILHTFAEFQHCLQHMNYLNKLCGERIKCTKYHRSVNWIFIYNLFVFLKDKSFPKNQIENLLNNTEVFNYFKKVLSTYFKCVAAVITV